MKFYNPNLFLDPRDPAYNDSFDADEAYEAYLDACEAKEEMRREERDN